MLAEIGSAGFAPKSSASARRLRASRGGFAFRTDCGPGGLPNSAYPDYNVESMPLYRIYRMKDSPRGNGDSHELPSSRATGSGGRKRGNWLLSPFPHR